jgi:hypothetical protein
MIIRNTVFHIDRKPGIIGVFLVFLVLLAGVNNFPVVVSDIAVILLLAVMELIDSYWISSLNVTCLPGSNTGGAVLLLLRHRHLLSERSLELERLLRRSL